MVKPLHCFVEIDEPTLVATRVGGHQPKRYDMLQLTPTCAPSIREDDQKPRLQLPPAHRRVPALKPKALSPSSAEAYEKDARLFVKSGGVIPCDALALQKYIWSMRNKLAPATLYRRCAAVRHAHLLIGKQSPTDDPLLRPLLRALQLGYVPDKKILQAGPPAAGDASAKSRKPRPSLPITRRLLGQMLQPLPRSAIDRRDRALILLGFTGALKRGTLVAINVGDVSFTADAVIVRIRSCLHEEGALTPESGETPAARQIALPRTGGDLCVANALMDYIEKSALDSEPPETSLFRACDRGGDPTRNRLDSAVVSLICKKWIAAAGIDAKSYSAQSLVTGRRSEFSKGVL